MPRPSQEALCQLRDLHKKHAAKVARLARIIERSAKRLVRIQRDTDRAAKAIAGNDYEKYHVVGFDEHGSIDEQNGRSEPVTGPGFVDIMDTARATADYAQRVAESTPPLPLPSE